MRRKSARYHAFQLRQGWGVIDTHSGELVGTSTTTERYPEAWARTRAEQLNKEDEAQRKEE